MTEDATLRVVTVPRLLLLVACLVTARTGDAQTLRIVNATVVDVATGELHRGSTIVVQGNRITSVGADAPTSSGQVVDATGQYVIPGLWDMHTHAFFGDRTPESRDLILPLFIANGVTGIRDMGSAVEPVLRPVIPDQFTGIRPLRQVRDSFWSGAQSVRTIETSAGKEGLRPHASARLRQCRQRADTRLEAPLAQAH